MQPPSQLYLAVSAHLLAALAARGRGTVARVLLLVVVLPDATEAQWPRMSLQPRLGMYEAYARPYTDSGRIKHSARGVDRSQLQPDSVRKHGRTTSAVPMSASPSYACCRAPGHGHEHVAHYFCFGPNRSFATVPQAR
eukprot:2044813-Rhodomonas_salina.1